ncbi:MAG: MFS transporter [Anaerolineaceae bacterium]|nr:MAG: MFS transporter [Anaerolineaceae bacterium]
MKRLSLPQLLALNAYWVGISFMWNALHPIILPAVLLNFVPDAKKNTWLGILTFVGLIIAMIIQPLAGALSDNWHSRWGRRRPLIVLGTLFDFIFLAILGWAGGLTWLFIGYIGLQFSSNLAHGPLQGLLPDRVPASQLGTASSLKNFMDMLSLVIVSLLAGRLMDSSTRDATLILSVILAVLAVSAAITIFGTREEPTDSPQSPQTKNLGALRGLRGDTFRINFRENASYWWLIAERGLFLLGIYGVQAFAQYYLQDVLRVPDPPKQTGDLLAAITIGLVILVLIGGWLTDKFGAKKVLYAASIITTIGMSLMLLARDMSTLTIFASIIGGGIGLFLTSNWALANALAPSDQAGKFLGLTNLATAGSGALARLEGPAIDALNDAAPGQWVGYTALFVFGAVCTFASMFLLKKIQIPSPKGFVSENG